MSAKLLTGKIPELILQDPVQNLLNTGISVVNNIQIIKFRKNFVSTDNNNNNDIPLNQKNYILFSQGAYTLNPNVSLLYHTYRAVSSQSVNLAGCSGINHEKLNLF